MNDSDGDDGEAIVPPDSSRPGQLRAQLLAMLDRGAPTAQMLPVARQRRDILREGWSAGETYEAGALFHHSERARFDSEMQRLIEESATFQGRVMLAVADVLVDDPAALDLVEPQSWWHLVDGHRFKTIVGPFTEEAAAMQDQWVQGFGWRLDDFVVPTELSVGTAPAAQQVEPEGVLVLRTQLDPQTPTDMWEEDEIRCLMNGVGADGEPIDGCDASRAVRQFYSDVSRGEMDIEVTQIAGPYPLYDDAPETTGCPWPTWNDTVLDAAEADGHVLAEYDKVIITLPFEGTTGPCTFSGIAPSDVVSLVIPESRWLLAHELGHNFGQGHAGAWSCEDGPFPSTTENAVIAQECELRLTTEPNDVMSYSPYRRFNAVHQLGLDLLWPEEVVELDGPSTAGIYELAPLYGDVDGEPKVLRFEYSDLELPIFTSYRVARTPFDIGEPALGQGIEIHVNHRYSFTDSFLLTHEQGRTHLRDDDVFWDRKGGLRIAQLSHDDRSATIEVSSIVHRDLQRTEGAERVEDVVVSQLGDGTEVALVVYHEATGLDAHPTPTGEIGRQHSQLVTRLTVAGEPLDARVLATPEPPTEFVWRPEVHAAAAFDPARGVFVVASTHRAEVGPNDDGPGTTHTFVRITEIDPATGEGTSRGHVDLGPTWIADGLNPLSFTEPAVDLVYTDQGLVMVLGHDTNNLGEYGKNLVLGRWSPPITGDYALESVEDLELRPLPAATNAKWPTLSVGTGDGDDIVAIAYTQRVGPSNNVVVLGYRPADDTVFAPGFDPMVRDDSAAVVPFRVNTPVEGVDYAFEPDLAFDRDAGRFVVAYSYSDPEHPWSVASRSLALVPGAPVEAGQVQIVTAPPATEWSHSPQIEIGRDGARALVFAADHGDFFDGLADVRLELFDAEGTGLGGATLSHGTTEYDGLRLYGSADGDWFYVLRSGTQGLHLEAVHSGW